VAKKAINAVAIIDTTDTIGITVDKGANNGLN
jgi:hypothetical protein